MIFVKSRATSLYIRVLNCQFEINKIVKYRFRIIFPNLLLTTFRAVRTSYTIALNLLILTFHYSL